MTTDLADSLRTSGLPLLRATSLRKSYVRGRWPASKHEIQAVAGISLELSGRGSTALVGKSGSGKSTLVRCLARMEEPDSGEIWFDGLDFLGLRGRELRRVRRRIQLVFQQSAMALNPAFSALEAVGEPLRIVDVPKKERNRRATEAMERMGLPGAWAHRTTLDFSGGERQRFALARALIVEPKLLILDEPLAGLDVLTRHQIIKLLLDLRAAMSISYLFVLHDLEMATYLADRIFVMEEGKIVETGESRNVRELPQNSATQRLVAAIPYLPAPETRPGLVS